MSERRAGVANITVFIVDDSLITKGGVVRESDSRLFESKFGNVFRQPAIVMLGSARKHPCEGFTT
jgi:hypothetical protein